jgi:hypothetical protein
MKLGRDGYLKGADVSQEKLPMTSEAASASAVGG